MVNIGRESSQCLSPVRSIEVACSGLVAACRLRREGRRLSVYSRFCWIMCSVHGSTSCESAIEILFSEAGSSLAHNYQRYECKDAELEE